MDRIELKGTDWFGKAWSSRVWHGNAWPGKARAVYSGLPIGNSGFSGGNTEWRGLARRGQAWRGEAGPGKARQGLFTADCPLATVGFPVVTPNGKAGWGVAGQGTVRIGKARAGNSGKGMAFTSVATLI